MQGNPGFRSRSPLGTRSGCQYPWGHCSLHALDPGELPRSQNLDGLVDAIDCCPWSKEEKFVDFQMKSDGRMLDPGWTLLI
jgi:hypothetical protein